MLGDWAMVRHGGGLASSVLAWTSPRAASGAGTAAEWRRAIDHNRRSQRFSAPEFRSDVFLSQPDGTHRFTTLPRIAQIAPFQGMAAGDFDGDGRADIYAIQNSYAPDAGVGPFAGGLSQLLRGDGKGNFAPVPILESGLVVPGNPMAIGARIALELSDGLAQTAEIAAGSGYYSKSTAVVFFGWPEQNPPRRPTIRWPGGVTSEHFVTTPAPTLSYEHP